MTDPAIAYLPDEGYGPFDRGTEADIWLMAANDSSPFLGAVWPGVTVFPDWFNEKTQEYVLLCLSCLSCNPTGCVSDGFVLYKWCDQEECGWGK